ncbi:hypothetical protein [Nonomuraea soli]|uniref:Uncharacterized protein n=1 Tax=Nonomuraea soli TaxID=1032476 RepID=A0A7W0HVL6_9ACTN|nr:hypothetical protein [Nonomuraea soli]MBA2896921.1 hypothetical protein [Nonomuraea soli]
MEIVIALVFAAVVLFCADRLLLWLEGRGHIHWRRKGRKKIADERAELDNLLSK